MAVANKVQACFRHLAVWAYLASIVVAVITLCVRVYEYATGNEVGPWYGVMLASAVVVVLPIAAGVFVVAPSPPAGATQYSRIIPSYRHSRIGLFSALIYLFVQFLPYQSYIPPATIEVREGQLVFDGPITRSGRELLLDLMVKAGCKPYTPKPGSECPKSLVISSDGGSVDTAYLIAFDLRVAGVDTIEARDHCESACSSVLLPSAKNRRAAQGTKLGFHGARSGALFPKFKQKSVRRLTDPQMVASLVEAKMLPNVASALLSRVNPMCYLSTDQLHYSEFDLVVLGNGELDVPEGKGCERFPEIGSPVATPH